MSQDARGQIADGEAPRARETSSAGASPTAAAASGMAEFVPASRRDVRGVLMLSGALDPATPPANGLAVSRTLPNSLHLTIPFGAHSPAGLSGLGCLQDVKTAFLERGSVEGLDTSCISRIARPPFATEH